MPYIFTKNYSQKKPSLKKSSREKFSRLKNIPWRKIFIVFGSTSLLLLLFIIGFVLYLSKDLPSPGQVNSRIIPESTRIYDRTGQKLLYEIHGEEKRTIIPFSDIPPYVKYATIVLEDQDFYHHWGIKVDSIVRAALDNFIKMDTQRGASTITQQLIKNSLLSSEKTYTRKIKEAVLSFEVERKFSKDEILEMYLNEIPYGSNSYGIQSASQTFFNKNARDLSLDEAALLASLPKAPSRLSPFGTRTEELKARQEWALTKMAELGYISQEESANAKSIAVLEKIDPKIGNIQAPHFVMYVRDYLEEKYGSEMLEQGGLSVITTLDWEKQQIAERVVKEGAEKNISSWNAENASLVAIDPKTGQILSMVGSKDFFSKDIDGQVNVSIQDRQPGSSIKPFIYLTAFTKGYTPETILFDVKTNFETGEEKDYSPQNYNGGFSGPVKMKEALARSLNIPAVKALYLAGINESISLSKSLGITSLNDPKRYGLSLVLGGGEVKLLDHTHAYATLALGGVRKEKTAILNIKDSSGNVLEEFISSEGVRVVKEEYVTMLSHALSTNEYRTATFGERSFLRFDEYPVAVKTGTTNEYRDAWTMGYTPTLAVGVWVGNNDNRAMKLGADGSVIAAPIFRAFLQESMQNTNKENFPEYNKDLIKRGKDILDGKISIEKDIEVCEIPNKKDSYCLANDYCAGDHKKEKKSFSNAHTILYFVDTKDPLGEKPENPKKDPQYEKWEKGVKEYYKDEKFISQEVPKEKCSEEDFSIYKPSISFDMPDNFSQQTFSLQTKINAPYKIDFIEYFVNGVSVEKSSSESFSYTASEEQNNSTLTIKASLKDKNGNIVSEEKNISLSF